MKTVRKLLSVICLLGLAFGLSGCLKESLSNDTIILLGEEYYIKPLDEMIPDSLKTVFPNQLGVLHEGLIPPNIEGAYRIGKIELCHTNYIDLMNTDDMYLRVYEQHNRMAKVEFFDNKKSVTNEAYVMGNGKNFSLYMVESRRLPMPLQRYRFTRLVVFTGQIVNEGIKNLRLGFIYLTTTGDDLENFWTPGTYYIYKDKDGLSEICDWFDY